MSMGVMGALAAVAAYLLGSVSFAIVVSRVMRLPDPRSYGSGNPGATNVLRTGKKVAAVLTLAGDAGKGWLAVWLAALVVPAAAPLAGLAAFIGHLVPVFHRFQGGKGVATAAGVILGFEPWLGLAALATWLIIAFFFRYSSLASIVTAVFAPAYFLLGHRVAWNAPGVMVLSLAVMGLLLVWRHSENINRLIAGTESKLGAKKK
jgi:glycerol-3-phosphate acyltransferase PlsY